MSKTDPYKSLRWAVFQATAIDLPDEELVKIQKQAVKLWLETRITDCEQKLRALYTSDDDALSISDQVMARNLKARIFVLRRELRILGKRKENCGDYDSSNS